MQELIKYYAQKFHVPFHHAIQSSQLSNWDEKGILFAYPIVTTEEKTVGELTVPYDGSFGEWIAADCPYSQTADP